MDTVPDGKRFFNTENLKESLAFACLLCFDDALRDIS